MRRSVYLAVGMLAAPLLACSNTVSPPADSAVERAVTQAAGAIPYIQGVHVSALSVFDDPALVPTAFNDFGEVVGDSENGTTFTSTVFKWQSSRGLNFLRLPIDSFATASAISVNDHGQVVVQLMTIAPAGRSQTIEAAIWDWFGTVRILRPLGTGFSCEPTSLNNSGIVLGVCYSPDQGSNTYPTVWTRFGSPDALYSGGGGSPILGSAYAISDAGYISGQTGVVTGFVFSPTKQERLLTPSKASYPNRLNTGVSDSGWVAGQVFDTTFLHFEPAVWSGSGAVHVLYRSSLAEGSMTAISNEGIAVGEVTDSTTGLTVPIIWTAAHGLQRLPGLEHSNLLAKEAGAAVAINHVHQILGTIVLSTGQLRWVVWTLPIE